MVDPKRYRGGFRAEEIFPLVESKLRDFVTVSTLGTPNALWGATPTTGDALVVANLLDEHLPEELADLIEKAQENGAVAIPVAGEVQRRTPPIGMDMAQSFDVVDRLRLRAQPDAALPVVAADLARVVLTRTTPTMMKDKLRLFLCHRRADGEDTAAALDRELSARHEGHVFRDLISIQVGDVAQDKIEEHLESADVLVFLDTPLAGESKWVEIELRTALGRQVPIVWVQLGDTEGRQPLGVRPAGSPHIIVDTSDLTMADAGKCADRILDAAFELAVENVRNAHQTFFRVRKAAAALGKSVEVLDQRRLIYALTEDLSLEEGEYPRRPVSDIVQIFGRHPTDDDRSGLVSWLEENGYGPHDRACRAYDAAVLLDPFTRPPVIDADSSLVVAHGSDYLTHLERSPTVTDAEPELLLLGAFPNEPGAQEPIKQAVAAVAGGWLSRGGHISFGGHPTFTPMILDIAKRLGHGAPDRVTIFQSAFYVSETFVELLRAQAKVVLVREGRDKSDSLTAMRNQMVEATPYGLVAVVGGRTSENGSHVPGIDEEIAIAESQGLNVVLVGGAGGRVAELIAEARASEWANQDHRLTPAEHEWLAMTDDYVAVAELLWDSAAR
jgi:hypothetical protein